MSTLPIVRRPVSADCALSGDYHPVLTRVFAARGVRDDGDLDISLEGLHRADSLGGIDGAIDLLSSAVIADQPILIVADFDADGATSCAVAMRALAAMGASRVSYIVPNRFEYGYGLTPPIVEMAAARDPRLLITVDNGISSIEGVDCARRAGIDVLITDHHLPGERLPDANAIVNPNVPGDDFPSKALAGVGVIFYVMLGLRRRLADEDWFRGTGRAEPNLGDLLDLVALGTVADVVPLDNNNRRLVAQGLRRIRAGKMQPGVAALLAVAGRDTGRVTSTDLAFAVGPRLNAAGRLADMSLGIECLLNDDRSACDRAAVKLDELNRQRRTIEAEMKDQALALVDAMALDDAALPAGLCLHDPTWHQGVVGIVASRIKERYHRPVIAFAPTDGGELKGSGRSIGGIHMRDALDAIAAKYPGLLSKFGGHAMAAGLTLESDALDNFAAAFDEEVRRQLGADGLTASITTDGPLEPEEFTLDLAEELAYAAPWGQQFPEPMFDGRFDVLDKRVVGETHVRLQLRPQYGSSSIAAIAFGAVDEPWARCDAPIHAAFRLSVNDYRGTRSVQLIIEHAVAVD